MQQSNLLPGGELQLPLLARMLAKRSVLLRRPRAGLGWSLDETGESRAEMMELLVWSSPRSMRDPVAEDGD